MNPEQVKSKRMLQVYNVLYVLIEKFEEITNLDNLIQNTRKLNLLWNEKLVIKLTLKWRCFKQYCLQKLDTKSSHYRVFLKALFCLHTRNTHLKYKNLHLNTSIIYLDNVKNKRLYKANLEIKKMK